MTNGIENCLDVLLVASNDLIGVNGTNSTVSTEPGYWGAILEITAENPLTGAIDGATHTEAHVVEGERCSGVWDGTVLVDGSLPLGRFAEYMLMGPAAGDLNASTNWSVGSAENARVGVPVAQNFTKRIENGNASAGLGNATAAAVPALAQNLTNRIESWNSSTALFNAAVAAAAAAAIAEKKSAAAFDAAVAVGAAAVGNDSEKYAEDIQAKKRTEVRGPKGHGRPIPPGEGVKALGKRFNATDVKPPVTVTGPVFSPPTGAEYMVDKGFMERQGGASGRRFGG